MFVGVAGLLVASPRDPFWGNSNIKSPPYSRFLLSLSRFRKFVFDAPAIQ